MKYLVLINLLGIDKLFQKRLSRVGDQSKQQRILDLIALWKPYLTYNCNSKLIEVLLISILCVYGYEVPYEWKKQSFSFIRFHFLGDFLLSGKISIDDIYNMLDAEEYLIKSDTQQIDYQNETEQILLVFESNTKKQFNNDPIVKLLKDTSDKFIEYTQRRD